MDFLIENSAISSFSWIFDPIPMLIFRFDDDGM